VLIIAIIVSVCLSVRSLISKTARPNFTKFFVYTCYLSICLGLHRTVMQYVMRFRFCEWHHVVIWWTK